MWENDDNDEFSDEDMQKEHERVENLPIVKKANELYELVMALIETFDIKDKGDEANVPFTDEWTKSLRKRKTLMKKMRMSWMRKM
jgi:hypothetical protein